MWSETTKSDAIAPSVQLLEQVRGTLITQGISLNKWCQERGICRVWASDVLKGKRNGPKARELRLRIVREVLSDAS